MTPIILLKFSVLCLKIGYFVEEYLLSIFLKACSRVCFVKRGMQVHGLLRKIGLGFDVFPPNYLVSMQVARCRCVSI